MKKDSRRMVEIQDGLKKIKKIELMVIKQQREGMYITNGFDTVK